MIRYTKKYLYTKGYYIYRLTNPDGEFYIGATTNIENRLETYKKYTARFKNQRNLNESMVKWGFNNHKLEILEHIEGDFNLSDMVHKEMSYIKKEFIKDPAKCLNMVVEGQYRNDVYSKKKNNIIK